MKPFGEPTDTVLYRSGFFLIPTPNRMRRCADRAACSVLRQYLSDEIIVMTRTYYRVFVASLAMLSFQVAVASAQSYSSHGVVPGSGTRIDYVGDDFEDAQWKFVHRFPKSSRENDSRLRSPTGYSTNGRWIEGPERGQPDHMTIVPTPAGGLVGSEHALLVRTLNSGVPSRHSYGVEQDDLIGNCIPRLRGTIPVSEMPSVVVRVYLPPADQWENRSGPHFGFRCSASTITTERKSSGFFGSRSETTNEPYWPGMWIHFRSKTSRKIDNDSAYIAIRSDSRGRDFRALNIEEEQFGWWTLGMSFTSNGMVHYYAHAGVDDLTSADHLASKYPYGYQAQRFRTYFFDFCNRDDGKTWSTPFVIDDPQLYLVNATRVTSIVNRKLQNEARRATARKPKR